MDSKFFKYASTSGTEAILKNLSLRMSNPKLFNDPFELLVEGSFGSDFEHLKDVILDEFFSSVLNNPDYLSQVTGVSNLQLNIVKLLLDNVSADDQAKLKQDMIYSGQFEPDIIYPNFQKDLENIIKIYNSSLILCVSQTYSSTLMWSHYSDSHRGFVLGFSPDYTPSADSPLTLFKPVNYREERPGVLPKFAPSEFLNPEVQFESRISSKKSIEQFIYTKSKDWKYEKEFRIHTFQRDFKPSSYHHVMFQPHELTNLYIGLNCSPKDEYKICNLARKINPTIKIYKTKTVYDKYQLDFARI